MKQEFSPKEIKLFECAHCGKEQPFLQMVVHKSLFICFKCDEELFSSLPIEPSETFAKPIPKSNLRSPTSRRYGQMRGKEKVKL